MLRAVSLFLENCGKNAKGRDCDSDDCALPHGFSRKRETARSLGFFFPADAATVFGAETTGLGPFSEQVRQTWLTTFYWRFISSLIGASGSVLHVTKLSYFGARPSLTPRPLHMFFFLPEQPRPPSREGGR